MSEEHYSDEYGFTRPPDEIIAGQAIKANPHMPPWLLEEAHPDYQTLYLDVLHAFDTGELVWMKDLKKHKSKMASEKPGQIEKPNWKFGILSILWILWGNYAASEGLALASRFEYFLKLAWILLAGFFTILFFMSLDSE
jgi:hypothetical protein